MQSARRKPNKKSSHKKIYITAVVVVVLAGAGFLYYRHEHNKSTAIVTQTTGAGQNTKGAGTTPKSGSTTSTSSSGKGSNTAGSSTSSSSSSSAALIAPFGSFVSDHHPDLSGSPAPNTMASVCTTTPGATCVINFTMGSVTKSLPQETVGANGSASWNWKLQDIGLTQGTWSVVATAKLGSQTKSTADQMNLVVGP